MKVVCAALCGKNGRQRRPSAAIFPQKAAPHTSLSHYNAKYQITRNSRIPDKLDNNNENGMKIIQDIFQMVHANIPVVLVLLL